ncbi:MAG: TolC family outer membrane protein [Thiomicrorhabdus sp.]|nr:TolC family outer membrane protein [Thiomicrorhabdus sp.]
MNMSLATTSQAMELAPTVEDAIMHNPQFREQIKIHQGVNADLKGAKGSWYPVIDLGAGVGLEEIDREDSSQNTSLTRTETNIRLTENLFEGFATENEITRQQARLDAAGYTSQATANQIALDMVSAYITLRKEQELQKLSIENKLTHERILDQITQRSDAGIGNQVEVDQAKARLALANSNLAAAKNNFSDALTSFHRVLGRMPDNELIKPTLEYSFPETLEEAINIALLQHPTLRSANADIAQARAQHAAAASPYYPSVDIEIEQTFDDNINGLEGKNQNFQAMLRMRYNLYNGGKDSANRDRTASAVQQSSEIRNNTRRQTIENLRYAWDAKQLIGEQLEYVKQQINLTRETLEGYRKQFSLGRRSLLDLLNTEDEYISALRTLVQSESDYSIAEYRILNGMGNLIEVLNIDVKYASVDIDYSNQ